MKKVLTILLFLPISIYCQNIDLKADPKIIEIESYIQLKDSLKRFETEGNSKGVFKYSHYKGKEEFGWFVYFLNDSNNNNTPFRIRYYETNIKNCEEFVFYYKDNKLIFVKQFTKPIKNRNSKAIQEVKTFYFYEDKIILKNIIYSKIDYNKDINNLIEKANEISKLIYK